MKLRIAWIYVLSLLMVFGFFEQALALSVRPLQQSKTKTRIAGFSRLLSEAGIMYNQPGTFQEIGVGIIGETGFDYGIKLPGEDFEMWFQVTSLKPSWQSYERIRAADKPQTINPDSAYLKAGKFKAESVSTDGTYFERELRAATLADYHADAGKTYLVDLKDAPETRHYAYALIITLQKNHTGNLMVMCLTNDKGPDFFRNINRLKSAIRFK